MSKYSHLSALLVIVVFSGCRQSSNAPAISIEEVWSRPAMVSNEDHAGAMSDTGMMKEHRAGSNGVVYMTLSNAGGVADRLLRAQSDVCKVIELHQTIMQGDRMMMQQVQDGLEIPARGSVQLKPKDYHLMLMGLKRSLTAGEHFEVQLEFEHSGIKTVLSEVRKP